jgi:hypothetical protein
VVFPYYAKLNKKQKAIYRQSDEIDRVPLPGAESLWPLINELRAALAEGKRKGVESVVGRIADGILQALDVSAIDVKVLAVRPSKNWGELQGLYESEEGERACISVWMKTAKNKNVVAFKTFLRTVLHELCHHLDYEFYRLADSFHTEGFFKRESSLFHQLVTDQDKPAGNCAGEGGGKG